MTGSRTSTSLVYPTSVVIDRKGLVGLRVEGYRESFER
jgi:hypothetical protein